MTTTTRGIAATTPDPPAENRAAAVRPQSESRLKLVSRRPISNCRV
jgi:hypothetical protein